jgi:hypothetical protein
MGCPTSSLVVFFFNLRLRFLVWMSSASCDSFLRVYYVVLYHKSLAGGKRILVVFVELKQN